MLYATLYIELFVKQRRKKDIELMTDNNYDSYGKYITISIEPNLPKLNMADTILKKNITTNTFHTLLCLVMNVKHHL